MSPIAVVGEPKTLVFQRPRALEGHYILSPYATNIGGKFEMLVRLVNRDDDPAMKVSRIHYAAGRDGISFDIGPEAIGPGSPDEPDGAGCEDPTIARAGDTFVAFYSGYNAPHQRSTMLASAGPSLFELRKTGSVLSADDTYANPKEPALIATPRGIRMFFEYARDGASHIGVADAPGLGGPWTYAASPIVQRAGAFDSWHLSPAGAIRRTDGTHVLFYNGASRKTNWRINYVVLDESATVVLQRPTAPLIGTFDLEDGDTDIAFAASVLIDPLGIVYLYYSIADRKPYRSQLNVRDAAGDSAICASP